MPKYKSDYIGKIINGFLVIDNYPIKTKNNKRNTCFVVKCISCGKIKQYTSPTILNKKAKCECTSKRKFRNGFDEKSRLYNIYRSIIKRTQKPKDKDYKNYGARGIQLCKEWDDNYKAFYDWSINNGYTDDLSIDRIDVNGNYEPNNCRWVSIEIQANNKRNSHKLSFKGKTFTMMEWANQTGIGYGTIKGRIRAGWSTKKALTTPIDVKFRKNRGIKNAI